MSTIGDDTVLRDVNRLRARAHLRREQAGGTGNRAGGLSQTVSRMQDDRIDAGRFREQLLARDRAFEMAAVAWATGEIDDLYRRVIDEALRHRRIQRIRCQSHQIGIEAIVGEHLAARLDNDSHGQDGDRMRLDDHRIASGQTCEHRRIGIPCGKRGTADDEADATRHQPIGFLQRHVLAPEGSVPRGTFGHIGHGLRRISQSLDAAIERIGSAAAESLGIALAGDMHDAMGHFKIAFIEPLAHLAAQGDAQPWRHLAPVLHRRLCGGDQRLGRALRIVDPQGFTRIGRDFTAGAPDHPRLLKPKRLSALRLERLAAGFRLFSSMNFGARRILIRAPIAACLHRLDRRRHQRCVAFHQGIESGLMGLHVHDGAFRFQTKRSTTMAEPTPDAPVVTTRP